MVRTLIRKQLGVALSEVSVGRLLRKLDLSPQRPLVRTTWAPTGQTPIVKGTGARFKVNLISAISPKGRLRFMCAEGNVTADVFIEFLKRLINGR